MGIAQRLYSDFLLPSRMDEYRRLIERALEKNYIHLTLLEYFSLLKESKIDPDLKYFLHRHDIDTDPDTARAFFEIEMELGVKTSYYFRLKTMDIDLYREMVDQGYEAGYHYEELSDFCKKNGIKQKENVQLRFSEIRELFKKNVRAIEEKTGKKIRSVAAHGDFVNRKLSLPNFSFVNEELLLELKIELECYHPMLIHSLNFIGSDTHYPRFYTPSSPFEAIEKNIPVIYLLSHPRHWRRNILLNLADDVQRFKEGVLFN
ncbi:MAG: hypothetical protein IPJ86_13595 [Bacteroidetes bacterium]|nr:hypothetical protein [Bacteroidota bacterium]